MLTVSRVLDLLITNGITLSQLITFLLGSDTYATHPLRDDLISNSITITGALHECSLSSPSLINWAHTLVKAECSKESSRLRAHPESWFRAGNAQVEQFENLCIKNMAVRMESASPLLWDLLNTLLGSNGGVDTYRMAGSEAHNEAMDVDDEASETTSDEGESEPRRNNDAAYRRSINRKSSEYDFKHNKDSTHKNLKQKVVIISILLNSTNQNCNELSSFISLFPHSSNTPKRVIDTLAQMGVSAAPYTIQRAIYSHSR